MCIKPPGIGVKGRGRVPGVGCQVSGVRGRGSRIKDKGKRKGEREKGRELKTEV